MQADTGIEEKRVSWLSAWLPVLIGTVLIASTSSNLFSAEHTSGPFRWLYQFFFGPVSCQRWSHIHTLLRKMMHFFGYGAYGLLWLRGWWLWLRGTRYIQNAVLAVLGCGMVASADEFHQRFLRQRTGSPWDVLLDCAGALTFLLLLYFVLRIFRPKKLEGLM